MANFAKTGVNGVLGEIGIIGETVVNWQKIGVNNGSFTQNARLSYSCQRIVKMTTI